MNKKIFFLLFFFASLVARSQVTPIPISQLPTYAGNPSGGWVPIVIGGQTRKIDAILFGYNKVDSVTVKSDSVFYYVRGNQHFAGHIAGGGGGGALNLHQVLTNGNTSTLGMTVDYVTTPSGAVLGSSGEVISTSQFILNRAPYAGYLNTYSTLTGNRFWNFPNASGTVVLSVNGVGPDSTGNVTISTAGYTFINGLNLSGSTVKLGGALVENTLITGRDYNMSFGTTTLRLNQFNVYAKGGIMIKDTTNSGVEPFLSLVSGSAMLRGLNTSIVANGNAAMSGFTVTLAPSNSGGSLILSNIPKTLDSVTYKVLVRDTATGDTRWTYWRSSSGISFGSLSATSPIVYNGAGNFSLSVVPITKGGTGLNFLGTAGQLLHVNAGGTALEYFTPTYITSETIDSVGSGLSLSGSIINLGGVLTQTTTFSGAFAVNYGTIGSKISSFNAYTSGFNNLYGNGNTIQATGLNYITSSSLLIEAISSFQISGAAISNVVDSTTYKPLVIDGSGNVKKAPWLGSLATRQIITVHSLTGGGFLSGDLTLSLVNDVSAPGGRKYYGTDSTGSKGWYSLPSGSGSGATAFVDLSDVSVTSFSDNDLIRYSAGSGKLTNFHASAGYLKFTGSAYTWDNSTFLTSETDAIALAKTVTATQGTGILITGTATQALSANPSWTFKADTILLATRGRLYKVIDSIGKPTWQQTLDATNGSILTKTNTITIPGIDTLNFVDHDGSSVGSIFRVSLKNHDDQIILNDDNALSSHIQGQLKLLTDDDLGGQVARLTVRDDAGDYSGFMIGYDNLQYQSLAAHIPFQIVGDEVDLPLLTNLGTQNRIVGQNGTSKALGYITIGSGLSLSGGVLSSTAGGGSVTSVAATITSSTAISIAGSPITGSGTFAFTWTGTSSQLIRGDGTLITNTFLTANQTITWTGSGDVSGTASGTTSISPSITVTGIRTKAIPTLATGLLKYNGTAWVFDNTTYLTSSYTETQDIQAVTDIGDHTTNDIYLNSLFVFSNPIGDYYHLVASDGEWDFYDENSNFIMSVGSGSLQFSQGGGVIGAQFDANSLTATRSYTLPNASGILPLSVRINGSSFTANSAGLIDLGTVGGGYTDEQAQDAVGSILSSEFTYNDPGNAISINSIAFSKITGTVPVSQGGTGLTALGTANQLLRVNAGGTALEYFTPTSGGSGTVNSGTQYQLAYYSASGTAVSGLTLITASRALVSDANGLPIASSTTTTELGYVHGVTSSIQTQLDSKADDASVVHKAGAETITGNKIFNTHIGIGSGFSTFSSWGAGIGTVIEGNFGNAIAFHTALYLLNNLYYDGTAYKYKADGNAGEYYLYQGAHVFQVASSGLADATATMNTALQINNDGSLSLPLHYGGSGTKWLGVDNSGNVTLVSPVTSGETNTASNLGGGLANWDSKSGVDLRFNSFNASHFDLASNVISIDASLVSTWNGKQDALTFRYSIVNASNIVNLVGDVSAPGNNMFYGTNGSGTRGWYALSGGGSGRFGYSGEDVLATAGRYFNANQWDFTIDSIGTMELNSQSEDLNWTSQIHMNLGFFTIAMTSYDAFASRSFVETDRPGDADILRLGSESSVSAEGATAIFEGYTGTVDITGTRGATIATQTSGLAFSRLDSMIQWIGLKRSRVGSHKYLVIDSLSSGHGSMYYVDAPIAEGDRFGFSGEDDLATEDRIMDMNGHNFFTHGANTYLITVNAYAGTFTSTLDMTDDGGNGQGISMYTEGATSGKWSRLDLDGIEGFAALHTNTTRITVGQHQIIINGINNLPAAVELLGRSQGSQDSLLTRIALSTEFSLSGNILSISNYSFNTQTASYTLVLADAARDKIVEADVASANNVTVPPNSSVAYPVGTMITVIQKGAGQTTIVAGTGVTINSAGGALKLRVQYSSAQLIKKATNTWYLIGDITN